MNWLLIVVLAVIGGCGYMGYRKGLVKVLFSLLIAVISLVLVSIVAPFVSSFLWKNTQLPSYIKEKSSAIAAEWNKSQEDETEEERFAAIESYEVPDFLKSYFKTEHTAEMLELDFNDYISDEIAALVIRAASFVISFVVIILVLHLLAFLLNTIMKLPVLHSINRLGGLIAGLAEGLLAVWVFFLVITLLCSTEFGKECMHLIEEGKVLSFLYNANPLMWFLT